MHELAASFVLGYHGCRKTVAEKLVVRREGFRPSENSYDWLGHGIYFWLENPKRACEWAVNQAGRQNWKDEKDAPAVVGAVINLGRCLDLTTTAGMEETRTAFEVLRILAEKQGEKLPENGPLHDGDEDLLMRRLDCAVINMACEMRRNSGKEINTVKGVFTEGGPAYEGAAIQRHTHTQIAVRTPESIKGVFFASENDLDGDARVCRRSPAP